MVHIISCLYFLKNGPNIVQTVKAKRVIPNVWPLGKLNVFSTTKLSIGRGRATRCLIIDNNIPPRENNKMILIPL